MMGDSNAKRTVLLTAASIVIIATFYLLREHWGHALGMLPYLLLLACPLLHIFHGHGNHSHTDRDRNASRPPP